MIASHFTPLMFTLRSHFVLGKTGLETLVVLLVGLANSRTVNLSHLASQFPGAALHASNYRRLQRFFQYVRLDGDIAARLIVHMLKLSGARLLALDRSNWKLGQSDVNVLVLAVVRRRFRVPLLWVLMDHAGNSDTGLRIALMRRYLALFGAGSIKALLADREFIGAEWMEFLIKNNIPFVICLKQTMQIRLEDGSLRQFRSLLRWRRHGVWQGWLNGMQTKADTQLCFAAERIKNGELLIVASNMKDGSKALNLYRKRWGIECLFADAKSRGLNIEDTHMTDPDKLSTMLVVVALAITWAYRCTTSVIGRGTIPRKAHGRREKTWFRCGLDTLRNSIMHKPLLAINAWLHACTKMPKRCYKIT